MPQFTIREETERDRTAVREVNRQAFGQDAGALANVRGRVTYPPPFAVV